MHCRQLLQHVALAASTQTEIKDAELQQQDRLHLYHDPRVLSIEPAEARMIADEGAFSIWYKPFGMLSQGSKWADHCTISRWVETHLRPQRPAFVVHRLDRAATGLMIIAHAKGVAAEVVNPCLHPPGEAGRVGKRAFSEFSGEGLGSIRRKYHVPHESPTRTPTRPTSPEAR